MPLLNHESIEPHGLQICIHDLVPSVLSLLGVLVNDMEYLAHHFTAPTLLKVSLRSFRHISDLSLLFAHCKQVTECYSLQFKVFVILEIFNGLTVIDSLTESHSPLCEGFSENLDALFLQEMHHLSLHRGSHLTTLVVERECIVCH